MTGRSEAFGPPSDRLPGWLWLGLPLGGAGALALWEQAFPASFLAWGAGEQGLLEGAQVAILLAAGGIAVASLALPAARRSRALTLWLALAAAGTLLVAGEEASWGQSYLHWATPEAWRAVNDQGETNLHNVSSWLDQKPRTLLEVAVVLGGIALPLLALRRPEIRRARLAVILPPLACLPAALVAEAARLTEVAARQVDADPLPFGRPSEVHELGLYIFILLYLIVLRRRLQAAGTGLR